MDQFFYHYMESPVGSLTLLEKNEVLVGLKFGVSDHPSESTSLLLAVEVQLLEYFSGKRVSFDVPFSLVGTTFQMQAWDALMQIPYGETRAYADQAKMVGDVKKARAVGGANNKNPLPIIVPCHRVVGSDGSLGGYQPGVEKKEWLLELERSVSS